MLNIVTYECIGSISEDLHEQLSRQNGIQHRNVRKIQVYIFKPQLDSDSDAECIVHQKL